MKAKKLITYQLLINLIGQETLLETYAKYTGTDNKIWVYLRDDIKRK